jgi:hypothetical protein
VTRKARRVREVEWDEVDGEVVDEGSQIVRSCPMSFGTETVEISGRGNPGLVVIAAAVMTPGTHSVIRKKMSEFPEKEPEFELTSESLFAV